EAARMRPKPVIIGITGTKGKGTTSTLLWEMLKAGKRHAILAGNMGKPTLEMLPKIKRGTLVVLELSSFQLQDMTVSPQIAAILHMFPDHQDAHKTLKEYYAAKTPIARYQKRGDKVFFFGDDRGSKWVASRGRGTQIAVGKKDFKDLSGEVVRMPG